MLFLAICNRFVLGSCSCRSIVSKCVEQKILEKIGPRRTLIHHNSWRKIVRPQFYLEDSIVVFGSFQQKCLSTIDNRFVSFAIWIELDKMNNQAPVGFVRGVWEIWGILCRLRGSTRSIWSLSPILCLVSCSLMSLNNTRGRGEARIFPNLVLGSVQVPWGLSCKKHNMRRRLMTLKFTCQM